MGNVASGDSEAGVAVEHADIVSWFCFLCFFISWCITSNRGTCMFDSLVVDLSIPS